MGFRELVNDKIPNCLNKLEREFKNYKITYKYLGYDSTNNHEVNETYCTPVGALVTVKNTVTGESISSTMDLLELPVPSEAGFKIGKSDKQILTLTKPSAGWFILPAKKNEAEEGAEEIKTLPQLKYSSNFKRNMYFFSKNKQIYYTFDSRGSQLKNVGVLLKGLTGKTYIELLNILGKNTYILNSLVNEKSTEECIRQLSTALPSGRYEIQNNTEKFKIFTNDLFQPDVIGSDLANYERYKVNTSFTSRAINKELAKDVETTIETVDENGNTILKELNVKKGTKLSVKILEDLDKSPLAELYIKHGNKTAKILKLEADPVRFTTNELLTMINMYANALDGLGDCDDQFGPTSRVSISFDTLVLDKLVKNCRKLSDNICVGLADLDIYDSIATLLSDISLSFNVNLINEIKENKSKALQSSSKTNLMQVMSTSEKQFMDIERVTSEMISNISMKFNRFDVIDQPEGQSMGKHAYPTLLAKTDDLGFMTTPYYVVKNGRPTSEIVYVSAKEELHAYRAPFDAKFDKPTELCYYGDTLINVPLKDIKYQEISCVQSMSMARANIPFIQFSNQKRILMGINQSRQAIATLQMERRLVSTGAFSINPQGITRAKDILADYYNEYKDSIRLSKEEFLSKKIKLTSSITLHHEKERRLTFTVLADEQIFKSNDGTPCRIERSFDFMYKTDKKTIYTNRINANDDLTYQGDDIVIYNMNVDINKSDLDTTLVDYGGADVGDFSEDLALGNNYLMCYKTYECSTIEDASCIMESVCYSSKLTAPLLHTIEAECFSEEGKHEETFGFIGEKEEYMEDNGLPKIGTYLTAGSTVISKVRRSYDGARVRGDSSISPKTVVPDGVSGEVVNASISKDGKTATVTLAKLEPTEVGDKIVGSYGNKGVVSKVIPDADMPYVEETGEPIEVILSPLGVPSRMNLSQLLEVPFALAMKQQGKVAVVSAYHPDTKEYITDVCKVFNCGPKILVDGRTGERFKRPVQVGYMYITKLEHMVKKKMASVNQTAKLNPKTNQPQSSIGSQAQGEMETWGWTVYGCDKYLQDLFSIHSDDIIGGNNLKDIIMANPEDVECSGENRNNLALQSVFMCLGVNLKNNENGDYVVAPLLDSEIEGLAPRALNTADIASLKDPFIFGASIQSPRGRHKSKHKMGYIDLGCKIINPYMIKYCSLLQCIPVFTYDKNGNLKRKFLSGEDYRLIIEGRNSLTPSGNYIYTMDSNSRNASIDNRGLGAIIKMFENITVGSMLDEIKSHWDEYTSVSSSVEKLLDNVGVLEAWQRDGYEFTDLIISKYPILPPVYRPGMEEKHQSADLDEYYSQIYSAVEKIKRSSGSKSQLGVYDAINKFIGLAKTNNSNKMPLINSFFGSNREGKGDLRQNILSKRVNFSGRSVIIPAQDPKMKMDTIGIPFLMGVNMYRIHLEAYLARDEHLMEVLPNEQARVDKFFKKMLTHIASKNVYGFEKLIRKGGFTGSSNEAKDLMFYVTKQVKSFLNRQVVTDGRQPSLHKKSQCGFHVKITDNRAIEINPLVCKGYNADFDGDTMHVEGVITESAKKEVLEKATSKAAIINPKDGSFFVEHSQDMVLGMYWATMLYNNVTHLADDKRYNQIVTVGSLDELQMLVDTSYVEMQDLTTITINGNRYLSTAGRILFNSLFNDGFTDEPFENTLKFPVVGEPTESPLPPINPANYKQLKYDGLLASRNGKVGDVKYIKISGINGEIYKTKDIDTYMEDMQSMMEFGFKYSDISGMTISLEDVMQERELNEDMFNELMDKKESKEEFTSKLNIDLADADKEYEKYSKNYTRECKRKAMANDVDKYKDIYRQKRVEIDNWYIKGLVSEEGRKTALIELGKVLTKIVNKETKNALPRNNNLFIIKDSGARGSDNQISQTISLAGLNMRTLNDTHEIAILNSYSDGLTSTEINVSSYGTLQGVFSTASGTAKAGYATRQMISMLSGIEVVEDDCGAKPIKLKLGYDSVYKITKESNGNKEQYEGSEIILADKLNGKRIKHISPSGEKYLSNFLGKDMTINPKTVDMIFKKKIKEIECEDGVYRIYYKLTEFYESLLNRRYCLDFPMIDNDGFIDKDTLDYINQHNPEYVNVRLTLGCKSKGGICQHCYGLKYDRESLPFIGERVGIESAQAMGEPATQLVLSLFHEGGKAGTSASSGVDLHASLLKGGLSRKDPKAICTWKGGYVRVNNNGKNALLEFNQITKQVPIESLAVVNGEYVEAFEPLTTGLVEFNSLGLDNKYTVLYETADDTKFIMHNGKKSGIFAPYFDGNLADIDCDVHDAGEYRLKQQMNLLNTYYRNFRVKVNVLARHFELLVKLQTDTIKVIKTNIPGLQSGNLIRYYEAKELLAENSNYYLIHGLNIAKQQDVVRLYGGALQSVVFEENLNNIGQLVSHRQVLPEYGIMGRIAMGEDLTTKDRKKLYEFTVKDNCKFGSPIKENTEKLIVEEEDTYETTEEETPLTYNIRGVLDNFTMDDIDDTDFVNIEEDENLHKEESANYTDLGKTRKLSLDN